MHGIRAAIWASFAAAFVLQNVATRSLSAAEILTEDLTAAPRLAFDADMGKAGSAVLRGPANLSWRVDSAHGRVSGGEAKAFATHLFWQEEGEVVGAFASNGYIGTERVSQFALEFSSALLPSGIYAVMGYQIGDFETEFAGLGGYFLLSPDTFLKFSSSLDLGTDSFSLGLQFGETQSALGDWDYYIDTQGNNGEFRALAGARMFFGNPSAPSRTEPADLFPNAAVETLANIVSGHDAKIQDAAVNQSASAGQSTSAEQDDGAETDRGSDQNRQQAGGTGGLPSNADASIGNGHSIAAVGNGSPALTPPGLGVLPPDNPARLHFEAEDFADEEID